MSRPVHVVGVGMIPFTKPGASEAYPVMGSKAAKLALADAGVSYDRVEQAYVGYVFGDSTAGQAAVYDVGLSGIPVVNVNNNCATGSTALFLARQAVASGAVDCALALGFEQMVPGPLKGAWTDRPSPLTHFIEAMTADQGYDEAAPRAAQFFGGDGGIVQKAEAPRQIGKGMVPRRPAQRIGRPRPFGHRRRRAQRRLRRPIGRLPGSGRDGAGCIGLMPARLPQHRFRIAVAAPGRMDIRDDLGRRIGNARPAHMGRPQEGQVFGRMDGAQRPHAEIRRHLEGAARRLGPGRQPRHPLGHFGVGQDAPVRHEVLRIMHALARIKIGPHVHPLSANILRGVRGAQSPPGHQKPTVAAPFRPSIARASAGVAMLRPKASTMPRTLATCWAFDTASSPLAM